MNSGQKVARKGQGCERPVICLECVFPLSDAGSVVVVHTHMYTWNKFLLQKLHLFPGATSVCLLA